jgi:hypothetical protein
MKFKDFIKERLDAAWKDWCKVDCATTSPYDQGVMNGRLAVLLSIDRYLHEYKRRVKNASR